MPHLSFEYSASLDDRMDMRQYCETLRDALMETGLFPLAGTRVRGHRVDCEVVADGGADRLFMDLRLRIGVGRSDADKMRAVETVYDAAAATLRAQLGDAPFALSMELA